MTSTLCNGNGATQGYSIFDNSENEKQRILFNDDNERMTGFLKLPAPAFNVRKHSFDSADQHEYKLSNGSLVIQDQDQDIGDVFSNATFAPRLSTLEPGLFTSTEGNNADRKEEKNGTPNDITADVHKRLQEQLALKQREVQEIQQKIAKNKKWGDPRRGPSQERYKNKHPNAKLPMVRSCPESMNQLPIFDVNQRKRNEKLNGNGSNLDPNSPCFYPSLSTMNNPIWQSEDMQKECSSEPGEPIQTTDIYNPMYMATASKRPSMISSSDNITMDTDLTHPHEDNYNSFEYDKPKHKFGPVGRPVFKQKNHGRNSSAIRNEDTWPQLPLSDCENNRQIPLLSDGVMPNEFGSLLFPSNDNTLKYPNNSSNQAFNSSDHILHGRNVFQMPPEVKFEAPKDEIASNVTAPNVLNQNRMRIVRKRQDGQKNWRQNDQLNSSSTLCSSCKLHFQWPHVISCLHSFCFSCIVKNFDKELNQVKCPTCSTVTELNENGLQDLDLDFTMCKKLLRMNRDPLTCMTCSEDQHASTYCQECLAYICSDCRHTHETNITLSCHKLHDVKKIKEDGGKLFEVCSEHPDKILEHYCESCKQLVCSQCTSFGELHNAHVLGDINKLYNSAVNKIRLMNSSMDEVRNEVQKRIQPLTILKQHIETSIRLCKQDIHKYSNSLLAETEKCRSKARLVIDKAHEDFTKDIEMTQNLMGQYMSEYSPLIDFFRRYLFSSNPQDFMSLAPSIQKKIETMNEQHSEIQKHEGIFHTNVSLKADFAGINEYLQNQYNRIQITENLSDALPSDSTEMGRRIEKDVLAAMERSSRHSPQGSIDLDLKSCSASSGSDENDPQSEEFNYNRTAINFSHQFGSYGRGDYEFVEPSGVLYLQDGSLAVCDTANHRIMVYDSQFIYVRTIGQPPNLPPLRDRKEVDSSRNDKYFSRTPSCLYFPYRIAQCPQTENIVVVERPPSRDIQIFTILGQFIHCFGSDILQHPRGVAVDENGVIITVEGRTMKLMLFSRGGQLLHRFFLSVHLEFPNDIAARDGLIYISDNRGHCVHVFDYNAEHKHSIGNESVTYYPIGVSLTHLNQVVVTDNHNTFNISIFSEYRADGQPRGYVFGFKSKVRHANCYNVAVHPHRLELAVTSRENQVVVFNFDPLRQVDDDKDKLLDQAQIRFR